MAVDSKDGRVIYKPLFCIYTGLFWIYTSVCVCVCVICLRPHAPSLACQYAHAFFFWVVRGLMVRGFFVCDHTHPHLHVNTHTHTQVWREETVCCSVLQCVAVCCGALQCVAVCCSAPQCLALTGVALLTIHCSRTAKALADAREPSSGAKLGSEPYSDASPELGPDPHELPEFRFDARAPPPGLIVELPV